MSRWDRTSQKKVSHVSGTAEGDDERPQQKCGISFQMMMGRHDDSRYHHRAENVSHNSWRVLMLPEWAKASSEIEWRWRRGGKKGMIYARYLWSLFGEGISKQNRTDRVERVFDCVDLRVVSIKCRSLHFCILRTCTRSTSQHRYHLQTLLWLLLDSLNISSHFIFHFLSNLL